MNYINLAYILIKTNQGILIAKRSSDTSDFQDTWSLIGGSSSDTQLASSIDIAKMHLERELKIEEEPNLLRIYTTSIINDSNPNNLYLLDVYLMTVDKLDRITLSSKYSEYKYVQNLGDLYSLDLIGFLEDMIKFIRKSQLLHDIFDYEDHTESLPNLASDGRLKLFTDGGSRGNPGPSAAGYAIFNDKDELITKKGVYLGVTTNNQAEYLALKLGITEACKYNVKNLDVFMDSLLAVNQMNGIYKIRNRELWPIHESIKEIANKIPKVRYHHIPREQNKIADSEVNVALDNELK